MPKQRKKTVSNPPISFRIPEQLRGRLRRFARERSLGEAEALRLVLSEHLNELDERDELADAERWQLAQTLATHRRTLRGANPVVPWESIEAVFHEALDRLASVADVSRART